MKADRRNARVLALLGAGLASVGCSADDGKGRADVDSNDIAAQLARVEVRPGLWEVAAEIVSASEAGLPHELAARMKGPRPPFRHCITAAQAARPDANFLAARPGSGCRHERFQMRDGRIRGAMVCREPDRAESRLRMSGSYGAERYEMRIDMATAGFGPGRTLNLVMRQTGRRVGACTGPEERKQ